VGARAFMRFCDCEREAKKKSAERQENERKKVKEIFPLFSKPHL
jgi:hypothetical protein